MEQKLKDILGVSGVILGFGIILNFYLWLLVASTQNWTVTINFNAVGEGLTETVLYIIVLPFIVFSTYYYVIGFTAKYTTIKTTSKRLGVVGQVTFWTTVAFVSLVGICLLVTALLNR